MPARANRAAAAADAWSNGGGGIAYVAWGNVPIGVAWGK